MIERAAIRLAGLASLCCCLALSGCARATYGEVRVGAPSVSTRERTVAERYEEWTWAHGRLGLSDTPDGFQGLRDYRELARMALALRAGLTLTPGAGALHGIEDPLLQAKLDAQVDQVRQAAEMLRAQATSRQKQAAYNLAVMDRILAEVQAGKDLDGDGAIGTWQGKDLASVAAIVDGIGVPVLPTVPTVPMVPALPTVPELPVLPTVPATPVVADASAAAPTPSAAPAVADATEAKSAAPIAPVVRAVANAPAVAHSTPATPADRNRADADLPSAESVKQSAATLTRKEQFDADVTYRQFVRGQLRQLELDDAHDRFGYALYDLSFQVTPLPGDHSTGWCRVTLELGRDGSQTLAGGDMAHQLDDFLVARKSFWGSQLWSGSLSTADRSMVQAALLEEVSRSSEVPEAVIRQLKERRPIGTLNDTWSRIPTKNPTEDPVKLLFSVATDIWGRELPDMVPVTEAQSRGDIVDIVANYDRRVSHPTLFNATGDLIADWPQRVPMAPFVIRCNPMQYSQQVSSLIAEDAQQALALGLSGAAGAAAASGMFEYAQRAQERLQAIERRPLVLGFTQAPNDFGWLFGPRLRVQGHDDDYAQAPESYLVTATIQVPGWWSSVKVKATYQWLDQDGAEASGRSLAHPGTWFAPPRTGADVFKDLPVLLPRHEGALLEAFRDPGAGSYRPRIRNRQKGLEITGGITQTLLITGENLWRTPEVYIGGTRATRVRILPGLEVIEATFAPSDGSSAGTEGNRGVVPAPPGDREIYSDTLWVVTSTGFADASIAVKAPRNLRKPAFAPLELTKGFTFEPSGPAAGWKPLPVLLQGASYTLSGEGLAEALNGKHQVQLVFKEPDMDAPSRPLWIHEVSPPDLHNGVASVQFSPERFANFAPDATVSPVNDHVQVMLRIDGADVGVIAPAFRCYLPEPTIELARISGTSSQLWGGHLVESPDEVTGVMKFRSVPHSISVTMSPVVMKLLIPPTAPQLIRAVLTLVDDAGTAPQIYECMAAATATNWTFFIKSPPPLPVNADTWNLRLSFRWADQTVTVPIAVLGDKPPKVSF